MSIYYIRFYDPVWTCEEDANYKGKLDKIIADTLHYHFSIRVIAKDHSEAFAIGYKRITYFIKYNMNRF